MVELKSIEKSETIEGKVVRINEKIDSETQSVKVFIQSSDKKIKDGMFFSAEIKTSSNTSLAKLPEEAISKNIVKVQVENVEKEIEVEIYDRSEDYVFVKGLEDDSLVVIEPTIN